MRGGDENSDAPKDRLYMSENIATVAKLYLHPVKSMAAVSVDESHVAMDGIVGDRQYAFVRTEQAAKNSFPWMTARQDSRLLSYKSVFDQLPTLDEPEPVLRVHTPDGRLVDVSDPSLQEELASRTGHSIFLLKSARGVLDCQHVSVLSLASVRALASEADCAIDRRQFRATVYFEPRSGRPFDEDEWTDCLLQISDRVLTGVAQRDLRFMMVNLDPETGKQTPQVLRTIARGHGGEAGFIGM